MEIISEVERNEIFDLAYRFITETSENIFLTGKAGTGKTTFLKYLKDHCLKKIIVAAPTGVAAINAGGVTLHSLFQLPFQPFLPTSGGKNELLSKMKLNRQRQDLLRKMDLLVIDEISMVRCDTMDAIDTILKSVRRSHDEPFGGVQLLCIGDLYQLPPVAQRHEWNILQGYYSSPFFFDSTVIKEQMPLLIELNKIYRQKEDSFVALLNKVRNNNMDENDFEDLHQRFFPDFQPPAEEEYITLTSHNNQADQINYRELEKIHSGSFTYNAEIEGDFPENMHPAECSLVLKKGAQVMLLKNDIEKRYFNGKIGVIKLLKQDEIVVDCNGCEIYVSQETWENSRYTLNETDGKLEQEILGSFTQFPLRLAWAITIHKSQGLTFEKVMIDAAAAFSSGQVYVALSRCTSIEGIILLSKIPVAAIYSNPNVIKGQQTLVPKGSLVERFEGARAIYTQQLLEEIFSFHEINALLEILHFQIKEQKEKLNNESLQWINQLKIQFSADRSVGLKFIFHAAGLMKEESVIEKNIFLQKRINDAANHFLPKFSSLLNGVQHHPLITEHREVAAIINEYLTRLLVVLNLQNYYLQYCTGPFSVTTFLQYKLKYAQPRVSISCYASGKTQINSNEVNGELFETLKHWRDRICEESDIPIYMVANQKSLKEIACYLPLTKKDLMQIAGFGKAKAEKYGNDILAAVSNYCKLNNLESNMTAKAGNQPKDREKMEKKISSKVLSFNLFKQGKSISEIAKDLNLSPSTIEGHLSSFIAKGELGVNELVSEEKQEIIQDAVKVYGMESFKILKENLPTDITYGEIRMVMAKETKIRN